MKVLFSWFLSVLTGVLAVANVKEYIFLTAGFVSLIYTILQIVYLVKKNKFNE